MKQLNRTVKIWLRGLGSAFIGGAATAITTTVVAPETFNFGDGLKKLLQVSIASGIINAAFYLKKSPLPDDPDDKEPTAEQKTNP